MSSLPPTSAFYPDDSYTFLPFRFARWSSAEVFLSNDVGEFVFLSTKDFDLFIAKRLSISSPAYRALKAGHFLHDSASTLPIELLATKYRTKKAFLEGFTKLHLFIVTLRCDHTCRYCAASSVPADRFAYDMDQKTARRSVDLMLCCPSQALKVEFQGGEPLLNFDLVRFITDYSQSKAAGEHALEFVLCSNLTSLDGAILEYLRKNSILVSTSLDGPKFIHDAQRHYLGGSSYEVTVDKIRTVQAALGHDRISALMTATELSFAHAEEIVDEYVRQGFGAIFLRSLRPFGRAHNAALATERFLAFYRKALDYIIELNRQGTRIVEGFAQILLTKILTPFATGFVDLQSPAGAGIAFVAYTHDGDVYASDEARMLAQSGDKTFRLGNVHTDSFHTIFGGPAMTGLVASSCVEILPGCSECAFQPYCGADPIHHYATQGDVIGHRPTSDFCKKNMAIIKMLLQYLRSGDEFTKDLLLSWATAREHPCPTS